MATMTAKEYLNQARKIDLQLHAKEMMRAQLEADILTIRATDYSSDRVSCGGSRDTSDKVAQLVDMQREIDQAWDQLIDLRHEIAAQIAKLPDNDQRVLLEYRYLANLKWEEIAVAMHYSWQYLHKIHAKALRSMAEILKKGDEMRLNEI